MAAAPTPKFAEIALPVRVGKPYTYSIPEEMSLLPGSRVLVPFGKRKQVEGYVVGLSDKKPPVQGIKSIISLLDERPLISGRCSSSPGGWRKYYRAPWGRS